MIKHLKLAGVVAGSIGMAALIVEPARALQLPSGMPAICGGVHFDRNESDAALNASINATRRCLDETWTLLNRIGTRDQRYAGYRRAYENILNSIWFPQNEERTHRGYAEQCRRYRVNCGR